MELAYLQEKSSGSVIGFSLNQFRGYRGESFEELGVALGTALLFETSADGRLISVTKKEQSLAAAGGR